MKRSILLLACLAAGSMAYSSDVRLIVQEIKHTDAIAGKTYRVYAELPSTQHSLQVVFGDAANPLRIESSAPFYQSQYGAFSAAGVSAAAEQADATVRYDSWITVGYENNESNDMWDLGVDFAAFDQGGAIVADNGGWFLVPTDEKCAPNAQGLVLIGQFTSAGTIQGVMNLQGKTDAGEVWQARSVRFSTTKVEIFGCTDPTAYGFDPQATFNDGSCNGQGISKPESIANSGGWEVFPNPLRDNLINIQLHSIEVNPGATLDILDAKGSLVSSFIVGKTATQNGNRITIDQSLQSGTYQIVLVQNGQRETKTIVVQ